MTYKLATEILINRYYKMSQDATIPPMKLVNIKDNTCVFDFMGSPRYFSTETLRLRIASNQLWIMRDQYRELVMKFSSIIGVEIEENFDDSQTPECLKTMANEAIELITHWYS